MIPNLTSILYISQLHGNSALPRSVWCFWDVRTGRTLHLVSLNPCIEFGFWTRCMECGPKYYNNSNNNIINVESTQVSTTTISNQHQQQQQKTENGTRSPTPTGMAILTPDSSCLLKVKQMWSWYLPRCLNGMGRPEWHHGAWGQCLLGSWSQNHFPVTML